MVSGVVAATPGLAAQLVLGGPPGSGAFGATVTVLANGNFVVTDPGFDAPGPIPNVGAVHLFHADGTLLSTLVGTRAGDAVGNGGVFVLANGNFVVRSSVWDNGAAVDAGAVTFGSGSTGISGAVSAANSLVGSQAGDAVGNVGLVLLANGNYLVRSPFWNSGAISNAGAVTWASGSSGVSGPVSSANSLVGSHAEDQVGDEVTRLSNGNYVVTSAIWDNGGVVDAGAAIFGSGTAGVAGTVSAANALVGTQAGDQVGAAAIALVDGDYVVASPNWRNGTVADAGAATFGSGVAGIHGAVSAANSLVGTRSGDRVGSSIAALSNGHYVVVSPSWDDGMSVDVGAATFASGASGLTGVIDASNSLVGSASGDRIGLFGVVPIATGSYVVRSPLWNHGAIVDAGAVTWGSGAGGVSGVVSVENSLVGTSGNAQVGSAGVAVLDNGDYVVNSPTALGNLGAVTFGPGAGGVSGPVSSANSLVGSTPGDGAESVIVPLANGGYLVSSPRWDHAGIVDAGAVTFGTPGTGVAGAIQPGNSLVGTRAADAVGFPAPVPLRNGNYVVLSAGWDRGNVVDAGAATFGSGSTGVLGAISPGNSLVGAQPGDRVGARALALADGDYVVASPLWNDGPRVDVGAATFASGIGGLSGEVSAANSLVGSSNSDQLGAQIGAAFDNGRYAVVASLWDDGALTDAGAITLGLEDGSVTGPVDPQHSVSGSIAGAGLNQVFAYDAERNQLVVGQPNANRVVLHRTGAATSILITGDTPDPSAAGQAVAFTAIVESSSSFPSDGGVRFRSDSGETCSDSTPTTSGPQTAEFSCSVVFTTAGSLEVIAEYLGSVRFAYSASAVELHMVGGDALFVDGFESP
jgi:hypothetical protein